uniref:Uncharacterized protein MANES_01G197300 n=1 Tax=Rhizophora mucronata TaxID=61149 RepID=A0A2P2M9V5_RHIMU
MLENYTTEEIWASDGDQFIAILLLCYMQAFNCRMVPLVQSWGSLSRFLSYLV